MDWFNGRSDGEHRSTRGGRRPSVTEISTELLIGEYPAPEDIAWLKSSYGIRAVLNLQDDEDLKHNGLRLDDLQREYAQSGIKFVRAPIQDGSADAMAERLGVALADLRSLVESDQRVYLHCNAGMNRAPTLAIAFLRGHRGMS